MEGHMSMKKGWKIFIALFFALAINIVAIGVFVLWCKSISESTIPEDLTQPIEVTAPLLP